MSLIFPIILAFLFITGGAFVAYQGVKGLVLRRRHGPSFAYRSDGISYPLATLCFVFGIGTFILGIFFVPLVMDGQEAEAKCQSIGGTYIDGDCWTKQIEI